MNIFESLKNLEISEECFNDIMDIVEEMINEVSDKWKQNCKDKAAEATTYFRKAYRRARDIYNNEPSSKNGDYVLDARIPLDRAEEREKKLLKAISKHDKAKSEGKIKRAEEERGNGTSK